MSGSVSATPPPRSMPPPGSSPRPPQESPPPGRARSERDGGTAVVVNLSRQVQFLLKEEGLQSLREQRERDETTRLERRKVVEEASRPAEEVPTSPAELAAFAEGYVRIYHAQHPELTESEARDEVMELLRRRGGAPPEPPPAPERPAERRDATRRFRAHQLQEAPRGQRLTRSG